jgi:hypothetical protein
MADIDITQALKDTENSLRDFIAVTLAESFGESWPQKCGVSSDRVKKWEERKADEAKRQEAGTVEPRLLYYADFYDLPVILKKHWEKFSPALGDFKTMEVFLTELGRLRDPDAHRRELLPHQKHLAAGIAGEIRTRLIRYRSKMETSEDYFPRIEVVRDSLGNIAIASGEKKYVMTKSILRPGDTIDFVVTAVDPLGEPLSYALESTGLRTEWQHQNSLSLKIGNAHISKSCVVRIFIRSHRDYHAVDWKSDDFAEFYYTVLPQKTGP